MNREKIIEKFDELIKEADHLYQKVIKDKSAGEMPVIDTSLYFKLLSSTKFILFYLGAEIHNKLVEQFCSEKLNAGILQGVLESAKREFEAGFLSHPKILITAESMEDLLEQADYLLEQDYKDAACVLSGGVLELSLKSLLENKYPKIDFNPKQGIDHLNIKLYKEAKAYDKATFTLIDGYRELRNASAHGNYSKYDKLQVKNFIGFIRSFLSNWYSIRVT